MQTSVEYEDTPIPHVREEKHSHFQKVPSKIIENIIIEHLKLLPRNIFFKKQKFKDQFKPLCIQRFNVALYTGEESTISLFASGNLELGKPVLFRISSQHT